MKTLKPCNAVDLDPLSQHRLLRELVLRLRDFLPAVPTRCRDATPSTRRTAHIRAHPCRSTAPGVSTSRRPSTGSSGCPSARTWGRTEIPPGAQRCIRLSWGWSPSRGGWSGWDTAPLRNTRVRRSSHGLAREGRAGDICTRVFSHGGGC